MFMRTTQNILEAAKATAPTMAGVDAATLDRALLIIADMLEDDRLMPVQKIRAALDMFIGKEVPTDPEILKLIYDLIKDDRPKQDGPKYMDIEQDWPYICASFQQAYGIDLYADKSMHILRFQALLQGLPKDTKMAEVIGIRAAEIPQATKYNAKQIAELTRLKAVYALQGSEKDFQTGLAGLFDLLEARAKSER
jgi:hypothetical protein